MDMIKEYDDSIYFIKMGQKYQLIKLNICTKKCYVLFQACSIIDYYCGNSDLVIYFVNKYKRHCLFWDNKINIPKQIVLNGHHYVDHLIVNNQLYIIVRSLTSTHIYDFNGIVKVCPYFRLYASNDGKRIIHINSNDDNHVHNVVDLESIFLEGVKPLLNLSSLHYLEWTHLNFLILFRTSCNSKVLRNLDTNKSLKLNWNINKMFVLNNYLLVLSNNECVIYDVGLLNLLVTINIHIEIIGTNNMMNVLISDNWKYYRIDQNYSLKKVNIGCNYHDDHEYMSNIIKILMDEIFNVIDLPIDVLSNELYQIILVQFL